MLSSDRRDTKSLNFRNRQREMTWSSARHINSIVVNYRRDTGGFDGTRVYVGDVEVGQIEEQSGKRTYIFGGLEGNHTQVRVVGPKSGMSNLANVQVYGE